MFRATVVAIDTSRVPRGPTRVRACSRGWVPTGCPLRGMTDIAQAGTAGVTDNPVTRASDDSLQHGDVAAALAVDLRNARHRNARGDLRLVVEESGPATGEQGYWAPCGLASLAAASDALEQHVEALERSDDASYEAQVAQLP